MSALQRYREVIAQLLISGLSEEEEDRLLDEADHLWWKLSDEEQDSLREERESKEKSS